MLVVALSSMPDLALPALTSDSPIAKSLVNSDSPSLCLLRDASHSAMLLPPPWLVMLFNIEGLSVLVPLLLGPCFVMLGEP